MTTATRVTLLRLILVPVFVASMVFFDLSAQAGAKNEAWRYLALVIFIIASFSDAVDGYMARHWNQKSELGALLDPIADKLLLLATLLMLGFFYPPGFVPFPLWFPCLIIGRDALLLTGYLILRQQGRSVEIKPHWTGKLSTFFTFLAIGAVLWQAVPLIFWLCLCGAVLAVAGTFLYIQAGWKQLDRSKRGVLP